MGVREIITDPKTGLRTTREVPGYEDVKPQRKLPKMTEPTAKAAKETDMKTKQKASKAAPKVAPKPKANNTPKATFKTTIMALNADDKYVKKSQEEIEEDKQLIATFTRWVNSGQKGEFFAIRRK